MAVKPPLLDSEKRRTRLVAILPLVNGQTVGRAIVGALRALGWVTHHHGGWIFLITIGLATSVAGDGGTCLGIRRVSRGFTVTAISAGFRYRLRSVLRPALLGTPSVIYNEHIRNVDIRRYVNINRVVVCRKRSALTRPSGYETIRDVSVIKNVVNNGRDRTRL